MVFGVELWLENPKVVGTFGNSSLALLPKGRWIFGVGMISVNHAWRISTHFATLKLCR